ncbi:hypothetical protein Nepgr_001728 [Nepenthes gracilis]|uniref:Uncharacterized protein n=1 Tax=Nepenthes gracilis TaxID=150966 RepID=A0AAD3P8P2_NEPGR|nr:hypothetical protein Nepgr_001728 [Nepenthes gracilis]
MAEMCRRGGSQIPAFGDWEYVNELPITQYFESARQAGLLRYSSSSGECDPRSAPVAAPGFYALQLKKPPPPMRGRRREKRCHQRQHEQQAKQEARKHGGGGKKVFDVTVTELPNNNRLGHSAVRKQLHYRSDAVQGAADADLHPRIPRRAPKAVDEDLYQIPSHLLRSSHRKKKLGFITRCLVLPCAV